MPKAIKKKKAKKKKPETVEIKNTAMEALEIIKEKKRLSIYIAAALGIVIILIAGFVFYSSSLKKKAYSFELEAYNYYYNSNLKVSLPDKERMNKSLELFQESFKIKPSPVTQFYIGNCYYNIGEYDNAVKTYLDFIDRYKNKHEILPLVYQKLSSAYLKTGKADEAVKILNTLAKFRNGIFRDTALALEARYYETDGNHEEAIKKYEELAKDFPRSPWAVEAMSKTGAGRAGKEIGDNKDTLQSVESVQPTSKNENRNQP